LMQSKQPLVIVIRYDHTVLGLGNCTFINIVALRFVT
jgi:hypothetical protein